MPYEAKAAAMRKYMAHRAPGLLRTRPYTHEVLPLGHPWCTADGIEEKVKEVRVSADRSFPEGEPTP
ncbi:Scr1 family TA system antitoxin-like transcriptional regulator [Streptomyces sp. NPDC127108]|uniref:Scr1 family TA system antitoxin-like transcriptional regulator n=1 Tax=Streptomyces sp. NPDC127108 TaxID=3345361 RepID=UPI003625C50F